ncbi:MAG: membrane protein insertion efficiency factor YidD [Alphaproteobacteria bacterium]|jgi:putative membrane protein insertion efficiency factor
MKALLIFLIRIYQKYFTKYTPDCIYKPSCSEYAVIALQKYGLIKGYKKIRNRFNRCDMGHIHLYGTEDMP